MAKRIITILIAVLILGFLAWRWREKHRPITNVGSQGTDIIVLGDSIGAAYGTLPNQGFVHLLEKRFGVAIINASKPGDTTEAGLLRLKSDVLPTHNEPRVVIVELGGNDLLQSIPREKTHENLSKIIEEIHAAGAAVVLLGTPGPLDAGGLGNVIESVAAEYNTGYVKNALRGVLGKFDMMADNIHPNAKGHALVAKHVGDELHRRMPKVFQE
jgi:acyl-CoA thioesterase-1